MDNTGHWVKVLEIKEALWRICIQETLNGVSALLDSAEKLLESGGNGAVSAGLYTYAVEEYGKVLFLKQCKPSNGKVKIKYRYGFRKHAEKFRIAAEALPNECKTIKRGMFDPRIFDPKIFSTESVVADFEARMSIFYCDFLDSADGIKPVPQVDKELLGKAIKRLQLITLGI